MTRNIAALQSLWNGGLTGKRVQRVLTPACIMDPVALLWPDGIALDPCGAPGSLVKADRWACPDGDADYRDGLAIDWPMRTFCNPPYSHLKDWIGHASKYSEVLLLGPVRTHRSWWRTAVFGHAAAICWLQPIKFVGFDQAFPGPLFVAYWGEHPDAFCDAFAALGHCTILQWVGAIPPRQMSFTFRSPGQ